MNRSIAIVFSINTPFQKGCAVTLYSFLKYNSDWFKGDVIIYSNELEQIDKNLFLFCPEIIWKSIDPALLKKVNTLSTTSEFCTNTETYFYLQAFSEISYERILCLDSDMLVLGNIQDFTRGTDFTIVRDKLYYTDRARLKGHYSTIVKRSEYQNQDLWTNSFNAGIFTIGRAFLSEKVYQELLELIDASFFTMHEGRNNEQFLMYMYLTDQVTYKSSRFNFRLQNATEYMKQDGFGEKDIAVVHFTGKRKPWKLNSWFYNETPLRNKFNFIWLKTYLVLSRRNFLKRVQLFRELLPDRLRSWIRPTSFKHFKSFCMFIGYARSGHTLIAALLDAHPQVIIANELDIFKLKKAGFKKSQLFSLIVRRSIEMVKNGYNWTGYSYKVANQYQGKAERPKLIGVKDGGRFSKLMWTDPSILKSCKDLAPKLYLLHVIRNPFDIISTKVLRKEERRDRKLTILEIDEIILHVFKQAEVVSMFKKNPDYHIIDVSHEALIENPQKELTNLCTALELTFDNSYIEDCAQIVYKKPSASRLKVDWWNDDLIAEVNGNLSQFEFLKHYHF